jgi:sugar/nucleoside kinase (ribokinase family)
VAWDIAVAGTLHRDDVTTPHGRQESYGGSAVYFALAAARYAPVHLNGIVGSDAVAEYYPMFKGLPIDEQGLVVGDCPTFTWHAVHDFERWVTSSESAEEGCDPEWAPSLAASSQDAQVVFLASLRPPLQRRVLEQSKARLIGVDSMTAFIDGHRADVLAIAEAADVLFLDAREVTMLSGHSDWREAAAALCGQGRLRAVVVKHGAAGAVCVTAQAVVSVDAKPVAHVVDPTGAGDALAGGFLGLCARHERDDTAFFPEALEAGVRCAADAVSAFGTIGLRLAGTRQARDV